MGMSASPKNRSILGVDDPWNDDGFWVARKFKNKRRTGQATGGRMWRRIIRAKESNFVRREINDDRD